MCLDINHTLNNQSVVKDSEMGNENMETLNKKVDNSITRVCGGNIFSLPPVFDPNGEIIYVVVEETIRLYSIQTGEFVRDLHDNQNGKIVGFNIEPESKSSIIACTSNGTILTWKLDSNMIVNKLKLNFTSEVDKFLLTSIGGDLHGVISYADNDKEELKIALVDIKSGRIIYKYDLPPAEKQDLVFKLADGNSKYFLATREGQIFVVDKGSKGFFGHHNKNGLRVTAIVCHPEDDSFATGDVTGEIFLWSKIFSHEPARQIFHWHHMPVLSLAFSQSGTMLYSGGIETVLVKWQIGEKFHEKTFLPRLPGSIKHISVDPLHDKITLSLDENSIQITTSSLFVQKTIQDFAQTSIHDLGLSERFPAGVQMNPRNQQIVLNGRIGHLQFLSSASMKLLYNMDIAMRNVIPREKGLNIFNIEITHVAFSMNWMATVESWNDRVVTPESRLKFWKFLDDRQIYSLHTQIEQVHSKDVTSLEFSNKNDVKNLICATSGYDKVIKIWSLERAEDIENAKSIWLCIEQLDYKNLSVKSLKFSSDGSTLAAGFGNILCVWSTHDFKLRAALSAPASLDGSVNRIIINLPTAKSKALKNSEELITKRKKILELMRQMIDDSSNESLVKNITEEKSRYFTQSQLKKEKFTNLSKAEKHSIFKRVMAIDNLSFNQKIQILHKLHIYYKISNHIESEVVEFMQKGMADDIQSFQKAASGIKMLRCDDRYKVQWRHRTWSNLSSKRNRKFVSVRKLLDQKVFEKNTEKFKSHDEGETFLPIKNLANITNVMFGSEELSHMVIVTTPQRLMLWNLLTLKLHGSFKIQTKFITLDPLTNLLAIFTKFNELFVVSLWPYLVLYRQKNMPEIFGAIWVPRIVPQSKSLSVNWQATSQLFFLNDKQEVCKIKSAEDDDSDGLTPYIESVNSFTPNTPFAAIIAKQINDETMKDINGYTRRVEVGTAKEIVNLSSHAMPPLRMLSKDFIGSFLAAEQQMKPETKGKPTIIDSLVVSDDDDETSPEFKKILKLKHIEKQEQEIMQICAKKKEMDLMIQKKMKNLKLDVVEKFDW